MVNGMALYCQMNEWGLYMFWRILEDDRLPVGYVIWASDLQNILESIGLKMCAGSGNVADHSI